MCQFSCSINYPYKDPYRRVCSATPVDLSSYGSYNGSSQTTTTNGNTDGQYLMIDRITAIIIVVGMVLFLILFVAIFLVYQSYCKKRLKRSNEWTKVNNNIDYAIQWSSKCNFYRITLDVKRSWLIDIIWM